MNFKEFLQNELFDKSQFMNQTPENAQWNPELGTAKNGYYKFSYSVPSDPQKICGYGEHKKPCYNLEVQNGSIAFEHETTGYTLRWDKEQNMKAATESMNAILWAIGQYVESIQPNRLYWSATRKNGNNEYGREKVYYLWAARNLYPNYVPKERQEWVKLEHFLELYNDIFPNEETIRKMPIKQFQELINQNSEKMAHIDVNNPFSFAPQQSTQERQQQIQNTINNFEYNPWQLKIGDLVYVKDGHSQNSAQLLQNFPHSHGKLFKITAAEFSRGQLIAILKPEIEPNDPLPHNTNIPNDTLLRPFDKLVKADYNRGSRLQMIQRMQNPTQQGIR